MYKSEQYLRLSTELPKHMSNKTVGPCSYYDLSKKNRPPWRGRRVGCGSSTGVTDNKTKTGTRA